MPEDALRTPFADVLRLLDTHFGHEKVTQAFDHQALVASPIAHRANPEWLKTANCVGINARTIGSFWNIIPYALTLPTAQCTIHILPIWEAGVVASLYGPASWNVNPEFFSQDLYRVFPQLDTVDKQLRVVVNLLHLMGRAVGMDVVPHTDRFSEMVIANPQHFEWLRRDGLNITNHRAELHEEVQAVIFQYLQYRRSAVPDLLFPGTAEEFFSENFPESQRLRVLFGEKNQYGWRLARRASFLNVLFEFGFETVPATMGPPYRGLEVDPDPQARTVDTEGRVWRDFRITQPQKFSRAFGPLTRYKLYESKNDNADWELDFSRPRTATWAYVRQHYAAIQAEFGFDFMRGDMSHVQMRPDGVPANAANDPYYDLLGAVKTEVHANGRPWFGYFAESFLAPPNEMAYGDECAHLEASLADSTLGDLQSEPVGTQRFAQMFAQYRQWLETRRFAPNFTVMTADKDDPRFDDFYLAGNELRFFMALFLTDMPSYMALGFECRDPHPQPAPNEHYTKLYVFQVPDGPKMTRGPYIWGRNRRLYQNIARAKRLSEAISQKITGQKTRWLIPPDPAGERRVLAWTQANAPQFVFVANLDTANGHARFDIPLPENAATARLIFSTENDLPAPRNLLTNNGLATLENLLPGEGAVIELAE